MDFSRCLSQEAAGKRLNSLLLEKPASSALDHSAARVFPGARTAIRDIKHELTRKFLIPAWTSAASTLCDWFEEKILLETCEIISLILL